MIDPNEYIKTRKDWYEFYRYFRNNGLPSALTRQSPDLLAEKAMMVNCIHEHEQDGKVRVCDRFMDCDCAVSTGSRSVPATYYAVKQVIDDIYDNAEGTGNTWITFPDNVPERNARDLIMEAHENGHPHVVYT